MPSLLLPTTSHMTLLLATLYVSPTTRTVVPCFRQRCSIHSTVLLSPLPPTFTTSIFPSSHYTISTQKLRNTRRPIPKLPTTTEQIFQAQQSKPCIIFFDEVDGLAPVRSSRQDFVHASIVSTLLVLMDGLENNSEIIVIGATNRVDAIDPALRRPGRFDRELYFPLPCYSARKEILWVPLIRQASLLSSQLRNVWLMLILCATVGAHQGLEAETAAEVLGLSGVEDCRILWQRLASPLR